LHQKIFFTSGAKVSKQYPIIKAGRVNCTSHIAPEKFFHIWCQGFKTISYNKGRKSKTALHILHQKNFFTSGAKVSKQYSKIKAGRAKQHFTYCTRKFFSHLVPSFKAIF